MSKTIKTYSFTYPILILISITFLCSCVTVGPDYQEPENKLPQNWQNTKTGSETTQDLSLWWKNFNDPYLNKLIQAALTQNLTLQKAESQLRQARVQLRITDADFFPKVDLSAKGQEKHTRTDTEKDSTQSYTAGFDASWELDIFGGTRRASEASRANIGAASANLDAAKVSLVAETASQYINWQKYRKQLNTTLNTVKLQKETLQLTQWQRKAGIVTELDVRLAQSNLAQTEATVPDLQQKIEATKQALAVLIGKTGKEVEELLPSKVQIAQSSPDLALNIPGEVLRQRPDIRANERRLAMQTANVGVATAKLYPSFTLSGNIGLSALTTNGLFKADTVISSLIGSIAAPIFNAGSIRQNIKIQTETQKQALLDYQGSLLQGMADVETALVTYQKALEKQQKQTISTQVAKEATSLAKIQYRAGKVDFLNVISTEKTQFNMEEQLDSAQAAVSLAVIQLYKALGGGWQEPTIGKSNNE